MTPVYIIPTPVTKTITRGRENPREVVVQEVDLYLPGQRHPMAFEIDVQGQSLSPNQRYYLTGSNLFQGGRYGPELNRYGHEWVDEKTFVDSLKNLMK